MMGVSEDVSWFVTNANPLERNNESSNEDFDPLERNKESSNEDFDGGDALNHLINPKIAGEAPKIFYEPSLPCGELVSHHLFHFRNLSLMTSYFDLV